MKLKKNKNKIILSLITLLAILSFTASVFSAETATINKQLEQLKGILDSSSSYSAFQTTMLFKSTQNLIDAGIIFEEVKNIIKNSVEKSLDAYSVKKVFDVILETQQEGLPAEPLINKINEGLAKNASKVEIISAISKKAKNLKEAHDILNEAKQEGLEINGGEEMVKILADSLENDVPSESLSWLLNRGTTEGKSLEEIAEISEEFSYLSLMASDMGLSSEEVFLIFKKAIDSNSDIGNICENIQNNLESEIIEAKAEAKEGEASTVSSSGTPSTASVGTPTTEIGETPTQEAGEAPTDSSDSEDNSPEPEPEPADDFSPPEN